VCGATCAERESKEWIVYCLHLHVQSPEGLKGSRFRACRSNNLALHLYRELALGRPPGVEHAVRMSAEQTLFGIPVKTMET
jgi:hypothetical protein